MIVAAMFAATSCSDFSDYNETPSTGNMSADKTLWENISQNENLSDFAALVKKAGFDAALSQSHFYTVWAPANGTFDAQALMAEDCTKLLKEFVKNHIAEYNHVISGAIDERIKVLNEKSYDFVGDGAYTYDGLNITTLNQPSVNGIMHILNGAAQFYPNIYEQATSATGLDIDSVVKYFKHYEIQTLDTKNSVLGPTVNGKQTYIDSVMIVTNTAFNMLKAKVSKEDSSYTMLAPTNEAWVAQYNKVKKYFNYIGTTSAQDLNEATSTTSAPTSTITIDPAYQSDSLAVLGVVGHLFYNNNNYYNDWLKEEGKQPYDTLKSTTDGYFTNPEEIMSHTISKSKMSNGEFRIVDSLAFHPWEAWAKPLTISPYTSKVWTGATTTVLVNSDLFEEIGYKPKYDNESSLRYLWVAPLSGLGKPQMDVKLYNVLSTTYNIYLVLAPSEDFGVDDDGNQFRKANNLNFELSYCDAKGKLQTKKLNQKVVNNPNKVDTVAVGTFTFPVAYYGLGDKIYPNLKITTSFGVFSKPMMAKYTRDFRIISILMKPAEMEEFEANATKEN